MASTVVDKDITNPGSSSNPSRLRVRIVGKIRGLNHLESETSPKPWIFVRKSHGYASQSVSISFGDQSTSSRKDAYELDYCYEQGEDNSLIYSREIEPFISEVFSGRDMSIIAYGARGSGKTCTIQGSKEKPGLAVLAMAEILSKAAESGNLVSVSMYEVCHDHVFDLLNVNCPKVQVLESQGKINLKGLSKVSVKSVKEFFDICFSQSTSHKAGSNIPIEPQKRSHKGLTFYISSTDDNKNSKPAGKVNFIDLAGYEDSRRCSRDGTNNVESTRNNKSLYALLNVVHALNARENRVPYRESKLTQMLKESLGGKNYVLMLTCMHPSFCQDTIHTVSLASRSCQSNAQVLIDSNLRSRSASKVGDISTARRKPPFLSAKKQIVTGLQKDANSISNERKLFGALKMTSEQLPIVSAKPERPKTVPPNSPSLLGEITRKEFDSTGTVDPTLFPSVEKDISPNNKLSHVTPIAVNNTADMVLHQDVTDAVITGKENVSLPMLGNGSPPLSERIQKISENLKALCSSTPLSLRLPEEIERSGVGQVGCSDIVEPKTPVTQGDVKVNRTEKYNSPWESVNQRSSGMKQSFVQDYLKVLNSASKEELKGLKGIGEKRATYILELRQESPEPFKKLEDLENIGLSAKQIKTMMKKAAGDLFN